MVLFCAEWSCTTMVVYLQSNMFQFPFQKTEIFLTVCGLSWQIKEVGQIFPHKTDQRSNVHWHLLIETQAKCVCFMFHQKVSVLNIATFGKDKPNHTLARCVIFYQHCFTKNKAEKICENTQKHNHCKTAMAKGETPTGKKHTPLPDTVEGMFLPLKKAGFCSVFGC